MRAPHTTGDGPGVPDTSDTCGALGVGRAPDVVVVGGGLIGLVTAWRAAGHGLRTALVDPAPGGGAARWAAGMLGAVSELHHGEETLLRLNLAAAERYPAFVAELTEYTGRQVGYTTRGTLTVALDADDRAQLRRLHALQQQCGLTTEWLTGRECRRLEPMLAPGVQGGVRVDGDHQVDPRLLAAALLTACERAGVAVHRQRASRALTAGDRVTGVLLADGTRLPAGRVVLAAGSLSGRLAGLPAAAVPPVRPVKGQVLRLGVPPEGEPPVRRTVRALVRGTPVYLVPRDSGELVVGATSEEQGWDTTVTAGGVYTLLRDAHALVPGLAELPLTESGAGLRPASPDNAPLLGPTALPGLLVATGHHRNGVLLTPLTGEVMARVLTDGELPAFARPFSPLRFASDGAAGRREAAEEAM